MKKLFCTIIVLIMIMFTMSTAFAYKGSAGVILPMSFKPLTTSLKPLVKPGVPLQIYM